jgi:threonine dehydrogenase-like Zn-dependent dehydrogenase
VSGTVVAAGLNAHHCPIGRPVAVWATDSGFADYVAVREAYCRPIPATLPTDVALIEPVACASNAVELADVRLADRGMTVGGSLLSSGRMQMEPLVTHRFELTDIAKAFDTALDKPPGFVKSVVRMQADDRPAVAGPCGGR